MADNSKRNVVHNIRTEVDSFGRKKYKLEEVDKSDQQQHQTKKDVLIDTGRYKSMLIGRDAQLNIQKYLGKIQTNKKTAKKQVFYCQICKEGFKYDLAYITHLNSEAHNRKLGMNMKVKAVSLQSVSNKINSLIQKKNQKNNNHQLENKMLDKIKVKKQNSDQDDQQQENQHKLQEGKQLKVQEVGKDEEQNEEEEEDNEDQLAQLQMMRQMGLPTSFGSKKHKR